MQRQICWIVRQEDGVRREIRVTVMRDQLKWQFKLENEERWDYSSQPSSSDWDEFLIKVENRYQRRTASHADITLVRRLRKEALKTA
jgi:hypothetical protein